MSVHTIHQNQVQGFSVVGRDVVRETPIGEVVAKVNDCCLRASHVKPPEEKRAIYLEAFKAIKDRTEPELRPSLFQLFERYAMDACYANVSPVHNATGNSVDPQLGFRKSARLLELSFLMQLHDLGLYDHGVDRLDRYASLEELINDQGIHPTDRGRFIDWLAQASIAPSVLVSKAHEKGIQMVMAKTLIGLTYSLQNLNMFSQADAPTYQLHRKLQDWADVLIGNETIEQQQLLADYHYNRCVFMCRLQYGSPVGKSNSYIPVLAEFKGCYSPRDQKLLEMEGRISNMRGLIMLDSGHPDATQQAEIYFDRAYSTYSSMATRDKFFIGNVVTGLIHCFSTSPLDERRAERLRMYKEELESIVAEFKREGSEHCYVEEYPKSIAEADKALKEYAEKQTGR